MTPEELAGRTTLTVAEEAEVLGISRALAYDLAARNELPGCRRLGGRLIVVAAEVRRYLSLEPETEPASRPGGIRAVR